MSVSGHRPIKIRKDWLKSQKTDCSNPHKDLGPIEIIVLVVSCPIVVFLRLSHWQACYCFPSPTEFKPQVSAKKTEVLTSASGLLGHHVLTKEVATYAAWSKRMMLCRLYSWSESRFMIRNCSSCSRTNCQWCELKLFLFCSQQILFSASLVSFCFCISRTSCPIKFWSPGHFAKNKNAQPCSRSCWSDYFIVAAYSFLDSDRPLDYLFNQIAIMG